MKFKLVLLTSLVTATNSYAPGDDYEAGNDEAWHMINDGLAALKNPKGKNKQEPPQKPAHVAKAEAEAAAEAKRQAEMDLPSVHPEGKELNAALEKNAKLTRSHRDLSEALAVVTGDAKAKAEYIIELEAKTEEQSEYITTLVAEVTKLEDEKVALQERLAELEQSIAEAAESAKAETPEAGTGKDADAAGGEQQ